jgi:MYXO-CTERM domain-containing protein
VFAHFGGYQSGVSFTDGMTPAVYIGAAIVALGAVAAFAIGRRRRPQEAVASDPAFELAA